MEVLNEKKRENSLDFNKIVTFNLLEDYFFVQVLFLFCNYFFYHIKVNIVFFLYLLG